MSGEKDNIREQLSAYLDGELSEADARRVEAALEDDAELRSELAELRRVREMVASLPASQAPAGFVERVMARAERNRLMETEEQPRRGGPLRWARLLATAAVLLVAAGAGLVLISSLAFTPPAGMDDTEPSKVGEIARDRRSETETADHRDRQEQPAAGAEAHDETAENYGEDLSASTPAGSPGTSRPEEVADSQDRDNVIDKAVAPGGDEVARYRQVLREAEPVGQGGDVEQRVLAQGRNVDLYVSDVVEANGTVIDVLNRRGIVVEPPEGNGRATTTQWSRNYNQSRAAFANSLDEEQVQIVAFVPSEEMPELLSELQEAASKQDGPVLKLRVRGGATSAPSGFESEGVVSAPREPRVTGGREDLLRRQLDRQTAMRAAGDTPTSGPAADRQYHLGGALSTTRALAAVEVEPLLINLLETPAVPEELHMETRQPQDGAETLESQPAPTD
ncbi:MAG: anti-sigma factor family protein [Phycisphaerae bacterium]